MSSADKEGSRHKHASEKEIYLLLMTYLSGLGDIGFRIQGFSLSVHAINQLFSLHFITFSFAYFPSSRLSYELISLRI